MAGPASSATAETYMQAHERTTILTLYTLQKFGNKLLLMLILFLNVCPWKTFSISSTIFIKIINLPSRRRELALLDTLLKQNNGKISVLVYMRPTQTDQYLHCSSHDLTGYKESTVSSLFNKAYCIIRNKDKNLYKENASIK